ncbi:hypothetical protein C8J57DRAFT_1338297 [Mycena rebaudengoi]|nr:hypothetical protein C8J57DRAFT_1338297 [Mycena rebaudengoi]
MTSSVPATLPPYVPSPPAPTYSPEPADDETTVENTRARSYTPAGNYIKHCGRETLILTGQDAAAKLPTYGHNRSVKGVVVLEDRETVSSVVLKIRGTIHVWTSARGSVDMNLVKDTHALWASKTSGCPSALPFSVRPPTKFQHEGKTYSLPPSYELPVNTVSGLIINCCYHISLVVTRIPIRGWRFFTAPNTIYVPFKYTVRARPWRPVQPSIGGFFSDVKTMPEEWRQVVTQVLPCEPHSLAQPIYLHLFLPSVEIFGLQDAIPFHIQNIQVSLIRQVVLDLGGHHSRGMLVLGHATLACCPPGCGTSCDYAAGFDYTASLDWDGEVRCNADVAVGTFDAGVIRVQDFICVELGPPDDLKACSHFADIRQMHPIKLVTDSWTGYDGQG